VPLQRDASDQLLFVKHYRNRSCPETKSLVYCGTLSVSESTPLRDRVKHVLRMCESSPTLEQVQILEILSKEDFEVLDLSESIQDLELISGSVIVVQEPTAGRNGTLVFPPYGRTLDPPVAADNPILHLLFLQTMDGELTDVVLSSPPTTTPPFQVAAHKCILASLPYFKTAFTNGMSESTAGCVVNLEIPIDVQQVVVHEFIRFVYLRNSTRLAKLAPALRLALLRLADYYGFEELSQAVVDSLGKCYSSLTGELALQVLRTIHPLGLDEAQVEDMALTYIACNFSEVGKLAVFREQLEDEIYEKVVDYVARATW
jgi:ICP0-binding domain of Ubiquitin-specific protease 7/BTB/POZ domain